MITQFLPSLLHMASVKVSSLLLNNYDFATLKSACISLQEGTLIKLDEIFENPNFFNHKASLLECKIEQLECEIELFRCRRTSVRNESSLELRKSALEKRRSDLERNIIEYCNTDPFIKQYRAQQFLKHKIPPCLRLRVLEAVQGMEFCVRRWKSYHLDFLELEKEKFIFSWKSNGTIDRIKTAQQLVRNKNIDIGNRFLLACIYCLEKSIQALWSEMEKSNRTNYFKTYDKKTVHFWVRRMVCDLPVHWKEDLSSYLLRYPQMISNFISVFPLIKPQDRRKFLPYLESEKHDIFRLCLDAMTKEEEEWILMSYPCKLLLCYLQWPLRGMFLEIADKVWNYIDHFDFLLVLERLFFIKKYDVVDVSDLFEGFWERSNRRFRRFAKEYPGIRKKITSWIEEIQKKRKAHYNELRSFKRTRLV